MINPKVVDLYHGDDLVYTDEEHDFALAYAAGIRGIIHKATEGANEVDQRYNDRKMAARKAGMLWGAYHFMRPGDPIAQAHHFVTVVNLAVGPLGQTRLVLDHEAEGVGMGQALQWLNAVRSITKQTPWLYSGFLIKEQEARQYMPAFAEFPLWLAQYPKHDTVAKVPRPWQKCVLWQFTGDGVGPEPHSVAGIAHKNCDISSFDGTDEELRAAWLGQELVA
jgi:lysozyme